MAVYSCSVTERSGNKVKMKEETETVLKRSQAYLSHEQVDRLLDVMNEQIDVHGRGNFPTLRLTLIALMKRVFYHMQVRDMKVNRVKMNGGAASHILGSRDLPYTDIDLIFGGVDLSRPKYFESIKDAVLEALIDFLPASTNKSKITPTAMKEAYVKKMVKVCNEDMWSLISLNNDLGRFIELKFVHRMRRQFEFSVDSFQIHLDSVLAWDDDERAHQTEPADQQKIDTTRNGGKSFVTPENLVVLAESVYGDFSRALMHLNKMLIDTTEPELIRGGGLLKYCQLLAKGYRPARVGQCRNLEPYMCSRFFIDFPTVVDQQKKLRVYMDNHFRGNTTAKYGYLQLVYRVVDESTVCLMNQDRRLTLSMIEVMARELNARMYYEEQRRRALLAAKALSQTAYESNSTRSTTPTVISVGDCTRPISNDDQSSCSGTTTIEHRPKQTLLYVPPNASYWIKVV